MTSSEIEDRMVHVIDGGWGELPTELLDAMKSAIEASCWDWDSSPLLKSARLVNRHWRDWATQATTSLRPHCHQADHASVHRMLEALATAFPNVQDLYLPADLRITNSHISALAGLPKLRRLELKYGMLITKTGVDLLGKFTGLAALKMCMCHRLSEGELWHLAALTGLRELSLRKFPIAAGVLGFLGTMTSLTVLDLKRTHITDRQVGWLTCLQSLRFLNLSGNSRVTDLGVRSLSALSALEGLDLSDNERVTAIGLRTLMGLPTLTALSLESCNAVTNDALTSLVQCQSITSLNLANMLRVSRRGASVLSKLTSLVDLQLGAAKWATHARNVSGTCWISWLRGVGLCGAHLPLSCLALWDCTGISDSMVGRLAFLTSLKTLKMWNCQGIKDAGVVRLASLTGLVELWLAGADVTDFGLGSLAMARSLTWLRLVCCPRITREGVGALAAMPRMQRLAVEGCGLFGGEGARKATGWDTRAPPGWHKASQWRWFLD
eukprot:evm.model.scf_1695.1 EVM.evm.TU.scf_1695.1   scf_1695:8479-10931(-)